MSVNENQPSLKDCFEKARDLLFSQLQKEEGLNLNMSGETTEFVRFNQNKIRQATKVEQADLFMELSFNKKKVSFQTELSRNPEQNEKRLLENLISLREEMHSLPDDPFFTSLSNEGTSESILAGDIPTCEDFVASVCQYAEGSDLAGYLTNGETFRASANSLGQNHWFQSMSFFLDYSLYSAKERAVKGSYAGPHFNKEELGALIEESKQALKVMDREQVVLKPGKYRCYLAPAALHEIAGLLGWHALSAGAYKRGECPLGDLYEGKKSFSPLVSLRENFQLGISPRFNDWGEVSPETLPLVTNGKMDDLLISRETASEYNLQSNQANRSESPRSLEMLPGELEQSEILKEIGTGLYLSNLHYLNWSDKPKGRLTGMTRFGCLWVENGEIVGPIKDLRFDETLYHIFGQGLKAVTKEAQTIMETGTYHQRSLGGAKLPGLLLEDFTFTL